MVDIAYIVPSRIPGTAANAIHTMKMAQALLEIDPALLSITVKGVGDCSPETIKSVYGLQKAPQLVRLAAKGRYGIHLFNIRAALRARLKGAKCVLSRSIGAATMAARLGLPTIYECHAPPQGFEKKYWNLLTRSKQCKRIIVISNALRNIILERIPGADKLDIVVAHDGVDLDRFRNLGDAATTKHKAGRDPSRPIAAYAGHLYAGRGIEIILACAKALPDWDFVLAGGTKQDVQNFTDETARLGLSNIEFWGFVPNSTLAEKLSIADVLLMPYQKTVAVSSGSLDTAQWMSPLKMFEYLAMGRAIISSDLPVLREVLNSENAALVEADSPASWIKALQNLETAEARLPLINAASKSVGQYDWRKRAASILQDIPEIGTQI